MTLIIRNLSTVPISCKLTVTMLTFSLDRTNTQTIPETFADTVNTHSVCRITDAHLTRPA